MTSSCGGQPRADRPAVTAWTVTGAAPGLPAPAPCTRRTSPASSRRPRPSVPRAPRGGRGAAQSLRQVARRGVGRMGPGHHLGLLCGLRIADHRRASGIASRPSNTLVPCRCRARGADQGSTGATPAGPRPWCGTPPRRGSAVMRTPAMTPVGAVARGLAAAAVGTLAMDLLLFARYKRGDGKSGFREWELSAGIESWDQAPGTGAGRQAAGRGPVPDATLPDRLAPLVNNITHWGYGILGGAPVRARRRLAPRRPRVWFGAAVRRGGVGVGLRRPARRRAVPADLGVRPPHARQRPQRPPGLRAHHGCGVPGAVSATRTVEHDRRPGRPRGARALHGPAVGHAPPDAGRRRGRDAQGLRRPPHLRAARRLAERVHRRAPPRRRRSPGTTSGTRRRPRSPRPARPIDRRAGGLRRQLRAGQPAPDQRPVRRQPQPRARCWRSPRTSPARRSAAATSRRPTRRSCSASAASTAELVSIPEQMPRVLQIAMRTRVERRRRRRRGRPRRDRPGRGDRRDAGAGDRPAARRRCRPRDERRGRGRRCSTPPAKVTILAGAGCEGAHDELIALAGRSRRRSSTRCAARSSSSTTTRTTSA